MAHRSPATARGAQPAIDAVLTALASPLRRAILTYLERSDHRAVPVDSLLDDLAERADDPSDRRRLEVALWHHELPKLRDLGLVGYSPVGGLVLYPGHPLVRDCLRVVGDDRATGA